MSMTAREKRAKAAIIEQLGENGYGTYAKIFSNFDLHLTADPSVIANMRPNKGIITVNEGLLLEQVGVCVRHEILHEYLNHLNRMITLLSIRHGLDPEEVLAQTNLDDYNDIKSELFQDDVFNYAGDYEISNVGYTEEDKELIRNIDINGNITSGLVTDDVQDHPDWADMSLEELYDAVIADRMSKPIVIRGNFVNDTTFVAEDGKIYGV